MTLEQVLSQFISISCWLWACFLQAQNWTDWIQTYPNYDLSNVYIIIYQFVKYDAFSCSSFPADSQTHRQKRLATKGVGISPRPPGTSFDLLEGDVSMPGFVEIGYHGIPLPVDTMEKWVNFIPFKILRWLFDACCIKFAMTWGKALRRSLGALMSDSAGLDCVFDLDQGW